MSIFLIYAFLFFIGSVGGWNLELIYRRFFSNVNPERKWINPGFCTGPYLPLYGSGLCVLYSIASLEKLNLFENPVVSKIALFFTMAVFMTVIEYISGIISLKYYKVRLWDYTEEWGNIQGIICPKFSFYWSVLGALYYFLVHPNVLQALKWLSENLAFSFFIGLFFGVFIIDISSSAQLVIKLKRFAEENNVVMRYEAVKLAIREKYEQRKIKYRFFSPFHTETPLHDILLELRNTFEERHHK